MKEDLEPFKEFLQQRNVDKNQIEASLELVIKFGEFLSDNGKTLENASYDDLYAFSDLLMDEGTNTEDNYVTLVRYGRFQKNNDVIIASMEILDGSEMIENFYKRLQDEFGEKVRYEIFEGIGVPPLGIRPKTKSEITKKLVGRFLSKFDHETCKTFFEIGLRDRYTESYVGPTKLFKELGDIDEFLRRKYQSLVERLETHLKENALFFTQVVDEEVISYVKNHPTIEGGIREGNRVIITKIPYMTKQFIHATDERMRRYYFCHNPLIRDALKEEDQPIDPVFCGCSAGYFKNFWEAVLGQQVRVEVLKSFINGDDICEFALHLPPGIVEDS